MEPTGCPETSVRNFCCSLRNNPEERSSRIFTSWCWFLIAFWFYCCLCVFCFFLTPTVHNSLRSSWMYPYPVFWTFIFRFSVFILSPPYSTFTQTSPNIQFCTLHRLLMQFTLNMSTFMCWIFNHIRYTWTNFISCSWYPWRFLASTQ